MLISNYITPVMYTDISGYAPQWWDDIREGVNNFREWVINGYKYIGKSVSEEFVADFSVSIPIFLGVNVKIGVSIVVSLEDEYLELYPHIGPSIGFSSGPAVSFGVLENYNNPGDYREWFEYGEAGFWVGGGHCYGVGNDLSYSDAVRAYYIEISSPNISIGRDYYYWNENLVFDWGD